MHLIFKSLRLFYYLLTNDIDAFKGIYGKIHLASWEGIMKTFCNSFQYYCVFFFQKVFLYRKQDTFTKKKESKNSSGPCARNIVYPSQQKGRPNKIFDSDDKFFLMTCVGIQFHYIW